MLQYLFALLPAAATCGWYFGRRKTTQDINKKMSFKMRHGYFKGLNYLIDEQPDKAVDVFVELLEVDGDTVETHLALGNLFRRRGEVERAIRIHQNIIARPNLEATHRLQALSELGQDYLRAGVLDRAERLFLELIELNEKKNSSYRFLLNIYQQEKDWLKAIDIAKKLQTLGESMSLVIAQYYCELAEQYQERANLHQAQLFLKKAQTYNPCCVRASLIRARLEFQETNYQHAIHYYQKAINQEPTFSTEMIEPLVECYQKIKAEKKMAAYLKEHLEKSSDISTVLLLADHLQSTHHHEEAIAFVSNQIQRSPSLAGLKYLVKCYLKNSQRVNYQQLTTIHYLIEQLINDDPVYRCVQCGFTSKALFWLCPSCHQWETIKPIQ